MKLWELLSKHKDNIRKDFTIKSIMLCNTDWKKDKFHLAIDIWFTIVYKSLSDLLFSTSFLSLLERKIDASEKVWIHQYQKDERFIEWYSTYENYHKINLVLLNTDAERIEYIEAFTL